MGIKIAVYDQCIRGLCIDHRVVWNVPFNSHPQTYLSESYQRYTAGRGKLQKRFLPYFSHPTFYVLFLAFFTKTIPERLGLESWFKGGIEEMVKDTGKMGLSGRKEIKKNCRRAMIEEKNT